MNRHYQRLLPSVDTLLSAFPHLEPAECEAIRGLMAGTLRPTLFRAGYRRACECYATPTHEDLALHAVDSILDTCGVEGWALGLHDGVSYCNTGDSYAATIAHTPRGWFLGDLATLAALYPRGAE